MIGIDVGECAYGVDQPVFKTDIPVGADILCMQYADELLRLAAQEIAKLGIRPGRLIEFRFIRFEKIEVIRMPSWVPSRDHTGAEDQVAGGSAVVAQVDPGRRLRHFPGEVIYGGIQLLIPGGVEVTIIKRDRVGLAVGQGIRSAAPAPSASSKVAEP